MANKKILYLDILRIIAIELVILLHCISDFIVMPSLYGSRSWNIFNFMNEICRTGVPIFLMISGFLMLDNPQTSNIKVFYKKHLSRILIPLLVWNVIYFIYFIVIDNKPIDIKGFIDALINNGNAYHLWFVYMLFGIYLVTPFIHIIVKNCTTKQLSLFFMLIIFAGTIRPFINTITPMYIYLFEPLFENYMGYFLLGYILAKSELNSRIRIFIYVGGIIGFLIGTLGSFFASSANGINLIFNTGYSINHYLVAAAIFTTMKYFRLNHTEVSRKSVSGLSSIVFGVFFIHVIIIDLINRVVNLDFSPTIVVLINFLLASFISFGVIFLLSKNKILRNYLM